MSSLKRIAAGASAVALAAGTTLAGASVASAQDDGTGSLDIGSIDIVSIGASLGTAAEALNGPVSVAANAEGGPTVTYTNEGEATEQCLGFTAPYSTIVDQDLDTDYDDDDILAAVELVTALEEGGGASTLVADENGAPVSEVVDPDAEGVLLSLLLPLAGLGDMADAPTVEIAPDEEVAWTTGSPGTPAIAVVACLADEEESAMATNIGIDPQVVADQMNDIFPGGSLDAGSVTGGSVELGAGLLTPFATASSVLGDDGESGDDD